MSQFLRTAARRFGVNTAVVWSLLLGIWQILAGLVSFILLTECLSPEERGYYMTFWSFVALQTVIDIGLTIVVTNFSSHEWAQLSLTRQGHIEGDSNALSRLVSLGRFSVAWFGFGAVLFLVFGGLPGAYVFAADDDPSIAWQWPWIMTVCASAGSLFLLPALSLLQGCGQVEPVYRFRLIQAVITNLSVWLSLSLGAGLWTAAVSAGVRLFAEAVFLTYRYRQFFKPFWSAPTGDVISFRNDLWPVQWRVSIGGVFSYFAYFLFNPVMMHYHSAELAGQMGMTRQLLVTVQTAAQSWIQTRVPEFGRLVARRDFTTLDNRFARLLWLSTVAFAVAGAGFLIGLPILESMAPKLRASLLDFWPCALLVVGMLFFQIPFAQTQYVRAHKQEPIFVATICSNIAIGLAVWLFGWHFGAIGATGGYALAVVTITVPGIHYVFMKFRKAYQESHSGTSNDDRVAGSGEQERVIT